MEHVALAHRVSHDDAALGYLFEVEQALIAEGTNPQGEKRAEKAALKAKAAEEAAPLDLIESAAKRFMVWHSSKQKKLRPRTTMEVARIFEHDVLPVWGKKRLSSLSRADKKRLISDIVDREKLYLANRVVGALKVFGKWPVEEEIVATDPFADLRKPAKETPRVRLLDDREIAALLMALKDTAGMTPDAIISPITQYPIAPLVKLLLLTGARRSEVAEARWSEFDLDAKLWRLPAERAKNAVEHTLPLPDDVVDILQKLPRHELTDYVFSFDGRHPVTGFPPSKAKIDAKMKATLGAAFRGWRLHDLRRTCASGMASLGIAPHVVEAVLNHKSGTVRGVAAVYNRYSYRTEMLAALTAWSRRVREIASGEKAAGNVVSLWA